MASMNMDQLKAFILEQTVPHIKDAVGKDVADAVREQVEAAIAPLRKTQENYVARMFAGDEGKANEPKLEPGIMMARGARAIAAAKTQGMGPEAAIKILRQWGDVQLATAWEAHREKALASNDPIAGGFLVPTQFSTDVIELLRAQAIVRSMGPASLPMPNGSVKVPKITAGANAGYIGENANIGKTQQEFGQLTLSWKKLAALVPISNDLVRFSSPAADAIVRDDIVRAMATREDQAFIRDNGTSGTPKGLRHWIHTDNVLAANATVSVANTSIDLGRMIQALMNANIPLVPQQNLAGANAARAGWMFSPRTYRYLSTLQNANGYYVFRDEMLRGTLWGYPYRVSTQILETYTAGEAASTGGTRGQIYFGAFAHAIIGEALGLMVDASTEAAYHDGNNVVASFSQDQTVIRVIAEHDFALRHDKAFTVLTDVTWGI